ncbi:hypothetical protein MIND_01095500 [Mycena indigotica]|uniref:Uncharacterized protein n=1 Tax=Mycena indigotica TaxID=2126181 RepID=A0A8H6SCW2_9AGAR|nr:uncharacterized protein MIND_01095500 [Mycena indigotica]KAF7295555.1 hypothetical protein MIND_01095500 [Mycena indigotica]
MSILTAPIIALFKLTLEPVAPFTWFGLSLSTLDVVAAFRLCIILRQIKESMYRDHIAKVPGAAQTIAPRAFARDLATTMTVVYGGEVMSSPLLGVPVSFMLSGVVPIFYGVIQAIVEALPSVPVMSIETELPLSFLDAFTRAYLLCDLIPPVVTTNTSPVISTSPWTLLLTSFITANGGFFLTNLFSFLNPTPLAIQTPPELQPYGWTATDLWCAPLVTALYALLTHAQPFWADAHGFLAAFLGSDVSAKGVVMALDANEARAVCTLVLTGLFVTRTVKNFGAAAQPKEKVKTQ